MEEFGGGVYGPPAGGYSAGDQDGRRLVMAMAALAGVLDLADTADTTVLRERLAAADPAADLVLTGTEEAAYEATVTRINALSTLGNPLDRWKY